MIALGLTHTAGGRCWTSPSSGGVGVFLTSTTVLLHISTNPSQPANTTHPECQPIISFHSPSFPRVFITPWMMLFGPSLDFFIHRSLKMCIVWFWCITCFISELQWQRTVPLDHFALSPVSSWFIVLKKKWTIESNFSCNDCGVQTYEEEVHQFSHFKYKSTSKVKIHFSQFFFPWTK